ncbi:MAG TPA: uroporphyrinogen-III synthase [Polyangia bacterium]
MSRGFLAGLRILLTRPEGEGADEWATAFERAGAVPIAYPTLSIIPPESWQPVDEVAAKLNAYDWMVFTSQTAVRFFASRLSTGQFASDLHAKIAAVGQSTAQSIERLGGRVTLVAMDSRQEGLVEELCLLTPGTHLLLPLASGGRTLLARSLRAGGCTVDVVTVYRTEPKPDLPTPPEFDVAVFASPSALRAYVRSRGTSHLAAKTIAVIGPTTAKEAETNGLRVVVADTPGVDALILAISQSRLNQGGI